MKIIINILIILLLSYSLNAQNNEVVVQTQLNNIFNHIDKSQIPNGYLSEYGGDFVVKRHYNGVLSDSNFISNFSGFKFLYNDISSSRLFNNAITLPSLDVVNNKWGIHQPK